MTHSVVWYQLVVDRLTVTDPILAAAQAAQEAAGLAARTIRSTYTGNLARQLSFARPVGFLAWVVGSDLPYARIEHYGGTIYPRNYDMLYLHDRRVGYAGNGLATSYQGPIFAVLPSVQHAGKHWGDAAVNAFPALFMSHMRGL